VTEELTDGRRSCKRLATPLHDDAVECLVCRDEGKTARLFNSVGDHLKKHGMTAREYRRRYPTAPTASGTTRGYFQDLEFDRGCTPKGHCHWTPDQIIVALKGDARRRGKPPTMREWRRPSKSRPSARSAQRYFGSWNAALRAAGLPTRKGGGHLGVRVSHCRRGHKFTPENTLPQPGGRQCRTCRNAGKRRRRLRAAQLQGTGPESGPQSSGTAI
jgi:hypothetical protein